MNYFQAYLPSLDEVIVAAWDSQLAEAADTPSLAQALAAKSTDLFPRFADAYSELRKLPRGTRRALQRRLARSGEFEIPVEWQRRLAGSIAGTALLLALGQGTGQAATITVDTTNPAINTGDTKCSLIEAIINANNDDQSGSTQCTAGSGADIIQLPANKKITLTSRYATYYLTYTGLPLITSTITIEGNGGKITRKKTAPTFRLLDVGVAGNLTLRNITLSGGRADDDGGALYNRGAVTIEDSTISGNSSADDGGGVYNGFGGTMTVRRSKVLKNKAGDDGGGLYNGYQASIVVEDTTISGNTCDDDGGGFGSNYFGTITITNSTISSNKSLNDDGGGVDIERYSTATITNSTISKNKASDNAGGVHVEPDATVTIINSTISKNTAVGDDGGGIANDGGTLTIENSTITGNKSASDGGGIRNEYYSVLTIRNSTISKNRSGDDGGGIANDTGTLTIENSTISGNRAAGSGGGVRSNSQSTTTISNSTIAQNKAAIGGGVYNGNSYTYLNRSLISGNKATVSGPEGYHSGGSVTAANYNIFGVTGNDGLSGFSYGATDIVPSVPLGKIIGPLKDNGGPTKTRALPSNSPAIDAAPLAGCPATDQRGAPYSRPVGPLCDIGAYEKQ